MLNIEITENNYEEIVIISATGKMVYVGEPGIDVFSIDVSQYASGLYFVRFVAKGMATTLRFIKE